MKMLRLSGVLGTTTVADTIDLGAANTGETLSFNDSTSAHWVNSTLHIANWNGSTSGGGLDKITFPTTTSLTPNQLNSIVFDGFPSFAHAALIASGGGAELVPSNAALTTLRLGDVNHNNVTDVSDVSAMMSALRDVNSYQSSLPAFAGWTPAQAAVALADVDHSDAVNNLDLQSLIVYLANGGTGFNSPGGGSLTAVPEPTSLLLLSIGGLVGGALAIRVRRSTRTRNAPLIK